MNIAIIPARAGSKRVKNKSIKNFCSKPVIAWTIESAQKSKCFDRIIVSTDCKQIGNTAIKYGAEFPFIRPENLADDFTPTIDVIHHAVQTLNIKTSTNICVLYPAAPFIYYKDLLMGLHILEHKKVNFVIAVTNYAHPIQRAFNMDKSNRIKVLNSQNMAKRTQDLKPSYHDAGQFMWGKSESWQSKINIYSKNNYGLKIPCYRVYDIDTEEDWLRAEQMFKQLQLMS